MTRRTSANRHMRKRSNRHLLMASLVILTTVLSLFGSSQLALAQGTTETGQVDPRATDETEDPMLQPGTGSVTVHVFECPVEFPGGTGAEFFEACSPNGMEDVEVRLSTLSIDELRSQTSGAGQGGAIPTEFDDTQITSVSNGEGAGRVEFAQLPADDYTVLVNLPGATYNFYSYCSDSDTSQEVSVSPNDENNGTITLGDGQNVLCDWFIIPDPEGNQQAANGDDAAEDETEATATVAPPEDATGEEATTPEDVTEEAATSTPEDAPVGGAQDDGEDGRVQEPDGDESDDVTVEEGQPIGGAADGATITIDMRTCPDAFVDPRSASYDNFAASCVDGAEGVTLRLTDVATNNFTEQVTDPRLNNTFSGLPDGTYTLYSDVPGDAASEYLFCVADGSNRYQKEFNENGVTTFSDLTGEQITCSWYVVPEETRGEETGGSLTIHAALCPVAYDGGSHYEACHDEGIAESPFLLSGPDGEISGTTLVPRTGGPGQLAFTGLASGSYTLQGGPPGEFGEVVLYCSDQATNDQIDASIDGTEASFSIAEGQDILCDWYFIPEDARGEPTEEPDSRAEILITLFECEPRDGGYAGWGFGDLDDTCTETLNDVPFRLGAEGATPLTANTGDSGDGAVRFYDLLPGNFTATPTLPDDLSNVALYCSIDGSNSVYQKSLQNGATTFNDVDGEEIACSWFVTSAPDVPDGPNGSITVREFLCEGDKSSISDWEKDCVAGASGAGYSLTSSDGSVDTQGTPNGNGVLVFEGLGNDFYNLTQNEGTWCRATAEHVDSSSRVIVKDGGNTDVLLFHCGEVTSLPSTGTGTREPQTDDAGLAGSTIALLAAAAFVIPAAGMMFLSRSRRNRMPVDTAAVAANRPTVTETGTLKMRFR